MIEQARLLVLKAAWLIDNQGSRQARTEIAAIKVVALRSPPGCSTAPFNFGAAGVTEDFPLAQMWSRAASGCLDGYDGPPAHGPARGGVGRAIREEGPGRAAPAWDRLVTRPRVGLLDPVPQTVRLAGLPRNKCSRRCLGSGDTRAGEPARFGEAYTDVTEWRRACGYVGCSSTLFFPMPEDLDGITQASTVCAPLSGAGCWSQLYQ